MTRDQDESTAPFIFGPPELELLEASLESTYQQDLKLLKEKLGEQVNKFSKHQIASFVVAGTKELIRPNPAQPLEPIVWDVCRAIMLSRLNPDDSAEGNDIFLQETFVDYSRILNGGYQAVQNKPGLMERIINESNQVNVSLFGLSNS